ncbi:hypothetical protein EK21DRAFT_62513 [Setomelanomma holmii]|uniref:Ubiquitin-like domain-containing protein n=1 Tax=Setomelanomma holmii TaxID=210430 RepID=A0A9P4LLP3_9PLEO|nr:hypothetical protein EK21DRAFT_62513 [Setomelanomma holmii]
MTDSAEGPPAPKKRSFFKRAAWQDAPKNEGDDMFSHANDFQKIVAEQHRLEEEKQRKVEAKKRTKHSDKKRRKVSTDCDEPILARSGSSSDAQRTGSKATPHSPAPPKPPPDSLAARYNTLARSASSPKDNKKSIIIDLGDSGDDDDDDSDYNSKSFNVNSAVDCPFWQEQPQQDIAVRPLKPRPEDDDEPEEVLDPVLAALAAKARERAANREHTMPSANGERAKAPVAQLFISPEIPDAKPLMVKVRIDSTLEKTRLAWCGKQGYTPEMSKNVFFTWKGTRVYDSTTIKRLGIQVDAKGNVSIEGDTNVYDDMNLPKVHVEAWTDELFQQYKREEAAEAAAKRLAAAPTLIVEEREPTPEPISKVQKLRLIMKAKGKEDFRLSVNPDTTFGHIADAYKQRRDVPKSQPITLMFDGDRLAPMDTIADSEVEDMDSIDVLFK